MGNISPSGEVILSMVDEIVSPSGEVLDLSDITYIKLTEKIEIMSLRPDFSLVSGARFICLVPPKKTPSLLDGEFILLF
jgi:hypothetical protein